MNVDPVRRSIGMCLITLGWIWIAFAGCCTLGFFGWSGVAFLRDNASPPPQHFEIGYELMVVVGCLRVGAAGIVTGLIVLNGGRALVGRR